MINTAKLIFYYYFAKSTGAKRTSIFLEFNVLCLRAIHEKLEVLINDHFPELQIKKINVAENPKLRTKYDVFSSPLIVLILDDKEYFRNGGNVSTQEIKEKIQRLYQLKFDK